MFLKKALPVISYTIANSTRCISHKLHSTTRWMSTMSTSTRIDSPWLMLPPSFKDDDEMVYNFYSLSENKVLSFNKRDPKDENPTLSPADDSKIVGSSHGWLALFNERNCDLYLSNPLTRRHIKLPPIHNLLPIPKGGYECVSKLIISCSPQEKECRTIIISDWPNNLAFCPLGTLTTEWTPISTTFLEYIFDARNYEDFVYSARQKLLFCLTDEVYEHLEGWDLTDPNSLRDDWFDEFLLKDEYYPWLDKKKKSLAQGEYYCRQVRYLVFSEESNRFFLVTRHLVEQMAPDGSYVEDPNNNTYPYKTIDIDVHEIDREGQRMSYMEGCLDGMAMFVGLNHSFLISGAGAGDGIKPNCIYFTDDKELTPPKWRDNKTFGGHDIGIFDYENKTISSCYFPCDLKSFKRIMPAPIWFTPSLY